MYQLADFLRRADDNLAGHIPAMLIRLDDPAGYSREATDTRWRYSSIDPSKDNEPSQKKA